MTVCLKGKFGLLISDNLNGYPLFLEGKRQGTLRGGAGSSSSATSAFLEPIGARTRQERAFEGSAGGKV